MDALCLLGQAEPKTAHKTLSVALKSKDASFHAYLTKVYVESAVADVLAAEATFTEHAQREEICLEGGLMGSDDLFGDLAEARMPDGVAQGYQERALESRYSLREALGLQQEAAAGATPPGAKKVKAGAQKSRYFDTVMKVISKTE